ncbi:MAG: hypothetical protein EZS28_000262 [Streblomastix strix]|uniref:Uncharacterized protein n=1 Tax=Streblomastix strix TaxID=222440 RepID=A0A5J4XAC6_9EUKA|nr:MAG: hypothetical protein EZS28_000262 [Streblomastix strix]
MQQCKYHRLFSQNYYYNERTALYNSPLRSNEELNDSRKGAIEGTTAYQRLLKDDDLVRKAGNTAVQVSDGGITVSLTIIELYHQIAGQVWKTSDAIIKLQIEESNTADENTENLGPNTIEAISQLMLDIDEKLSDQAKADHEENEIVFAAGITLRSAMKKFGISI